MTTRNDITGDVIKTGSNTNAFRDGWDRIFLKKKTDDELLSDVHEQWYDDAQSEAHCADLTQQ